MRVKGARNNSYYHYRADLYNEKSQIIDRFFFFTLSGVLDKYNVCKKTAIDKIKDPLKNVKKLKNVKLYRIKEPARITIENPIIC